MSQASSAINEQHLSQQFQHLSPFKNTTEQPSMKGMDFDVIPDYLADTNPYLETQLRALSDSWLVHIKALRDIAIVMHQIQSIELVRSLWMIYRQSGTGNLPTPFPIDPLDSKIWPEEVRSLALAHRPTTNPQLDDDLYLSYVDQQLLALFTQMTDLQQRLRLQQDALASFNATIEEFLAKLIYDGLAFQRMDIEMHIHMIEYDFIDTLLKRQYQGLALDPKQV